MTAHDALTRSFLDLRLQRAVGPQGAQVVPVNASGALKVPHDLAASPEAAAEALALLHELQVHQVELDLQAEALANSNAELEAGLHRQLEIYESLPVGCLTIDLALVVHDLNRAATGLLGLSRDEAIGLSFHSCLTPECERALRQAMTDIAAGRVGAAPTLRLIPKQGEPRRLRAHLGPAPVGGRQFLLVLTDLDEAYD